MQSHKTAEKQKAFAVIEDFIPISFEATNQTNQGYLLDQKINYKRFGVYLPFV